MSNRRSGLRTKAGQSVAKICEEKKPSEPPARNSGPYLPALGVYGFGEIEPVILAALITEDPLLLIGASGTGKTYLLNSLSEALSLEHRHYNASLISFDDLVGFPFPDPEGTGVRFLETPATVWSAELVLIDEISRSKPEQQNRLFSLVHERRVQGIGLPKLRYRWAAMNPCSTDQDSDENYTGSEPLDPALADRFALFVNALDWKDLSDEERRRVAEPVGEGRIADDGGKLKIKIEEWRSEFLARIGSCPALVLDYVTTAVTALNTAAIRMSPRRSRLLARSLLAATIVEGEFSSRLFRLILESSLPHVAWGVQPRMEAVAAAHRAAWDYAAKNEERWIHSFMAERGLDRKLGILIKSCRDPRRRLAGCGAASRVRATGARGGLCVRNLSRRDMRETADRRGGDERPRQGRDADPVGGRHDQLAGALEQKRHSPSGDGALRKGGRQADGRSRRTGPPVLQLVRRRAGCRLRSNQPREGAEQLRQTHRGGARGMLMHAAVLPGAGIPPVLRANIGGPMSWTRTRARPHHPSRSR